MPKLKLKKKNILALILFTITLVLLIPISFRLIVLLRERHVASKIAPRSGYYVETLGANVFVQDRGNKNSPLVVFVHGTGSWSQIWDSSMNVAIQNGYRAISLDLPPFGFSEVTKETDYSKTSQGQRINAVVKNSEAENVVLVAHSFGGGPAMEAYFLEPKLYSGVILVDAALGIDPGVKEDPLLIKFATSNQLLRELLVSSTVTNKFVTKNLFSNFVEKKSALSKENIKMIQTPFDKKNFTTDLAHWLPELILKDTHSHSTKSENYKKVTVPTIIIWGREDKVTPLEEGEKIKSLIAGSQLEVMEGLGHIPQLEDPNAFNVILINSLKEIASK